MIATPQIVTTQPQLTACIHLSVPSAEIRNVMGPALTEIRAALAAQSIAPAGPWLTHHFRKPTDTFDMEVCVPVEKQIASVGRVKAGELPATLVARTIYHGPYETLGTAWGELMAWIAANQFQPDSELWERYLAGPESGSDASKFQTELNRPVKQK